MYKNIQTKFSLIFFCFFALLIIFLPIQRLLEQILLFRTGLSPGAVFWLIHFYEPVIIIVILINCYLAFRNRRFNLKNINKTAIVALALIVLAIVSIFFLSPTISRGLEGFRFTIFALLAFLAASLSDFDQESNKKLINLYLIMAGIIALWAILERFLPLNYLMKLKLIDPDSQFGYGTHRIGSIWQSVTSIGGPNQLASYLLPAIFIALADISKLITNNRNLKLKTFLSVLVVFAITAIILTFSRSAWIGLYAGLLVWTIFFVKDRAVKISSISILILIAVAGGAVYYFFQAKLNDLLLHGASQTSHISAFESSMDELTNRLTQPLKFLFGSGLGSAGPAVLKYGDGFISESWYLQLTLEIGLLGLILWLLLVYYLLRDLIKKNAGLFLGLIAVSVTAIFLHTWADNPALSITLFILIGVYTNPKSKASASASPPPRIDRVETGLARRANVK